ncbi:DUF5677 domain-containing protein [Chromobacterium vaccinii]|uniref:DUF5677 domain-containing protein n=1 Tax=Chromobacterium vaccinii TaxID=1108595 RepID=UPI001E4B7330|nr:DUF5677 domain-containing protein [Chromobacterium vaccinii]MCD4482922.1 DUF5677 domain-containing protein [Chromobacterium vaccinii]
MTDNSHQQANDQTPEELSIPDLDEIIDRGALGPEPSESYLESLRMLDEIVRECIFVSRSYKDIPSPTSQHFYASVLFTLMITKCVSLLMLAPHTRWAEKKIEHWDYSSMTSITRTIIELRVAFYYLCVDQCPEDEWQFRWNLFNLHDCTSRIRMFEALEDAQQVEALREDAEELRSRLLANPFLATIDKKHHKRLLHGQTAYFLSMEVIAERAGIDLRTFRWLYVLFSSHVHALPMSFYRIGHAGDDRGRGLPSPSEEGYSALCLSMTAALLVATKDNVHDLFAAYKSPPPPLEPDFSELTANPPALAIGEEHLHDASDTLTMRFKRTSEMAYKTTFIYRPTGDVILERYDSEQDGIELKYFDPYFWNVKLNGGPTTVEALEQALAGPNAFRIDYSAQELLFKTTEG